jgi:hypothetical protein
VIRVPPEIAADLAGAVRAEREARTALRDALRRQASALRRLRTGGVPFTAAALASVLGEEASPEVRRRLAARLRQRIRRVTERHAKPEPVSPPAVSVPLPSVEATNEENAMPNGKLIKKTTTVEEYEVDLDAEADEDEADEVEDEDSGEDDEPSRREHRR